MLVCHISDLHIDRRRRLSDTRTILEKIVSEAKDHQVDLGLIAGDIYEADTEEEERALFAEFLAPASEICPWVVIRGNHEKSLDATVLRLLAAGLKHPVRIYERPNFPSENLDLIKTASGPVGIVAIPWFTKTHMAAQASADVSGDELTLAVNEQAKRLLLGAQVEVERIRAAGATPIGMHHGMIRGAKFSSGGTERGITVEFNSHDLLEVGCAYFALGHVHLAQEWHEGRVAFSGSTERFNFGEPEDKGYRLIEIDGDHFSSTFVPLPARQIVLLELDLTDPEVISLPSLEWSMPLLGIENQAGGDISGALVRFRYRIRPQDLHLVDKEAIERALYDAGAHSVKVEPDIVHQARVRSEGIARVEGMWPKVKTWDSLTGKDLTAENESRRELLLSDIESPEAARAEVAA